MKFNSLIPELSVSNIQISKDFYVSLGFDIMYERTDDKFAFMKFEENQIMIEEVNDHWNTGVLEKPFGRGINISMAVSDVEKLYNHISMLNISIFKKLETHTYLVNGIEYIDKEFLIQDPDGYLLRFND